MQKVEAYIKSHRLDALIQAMEQVEGLTGLSISEIHGFGRGRKDGSRELKKNMKIEVFCNEDITETVVDIIEKTAHTGLRSDGKIYIVQVAEAVRISTGERGRKAV